MIYDHFAYFPIRIYINGYSFELPQQADFMSSHNMHVYGEMNKHIVTLSLDIHFTWLKLVISYNLSFTLALTVQLHIILE